MKRILFGGFAIYLAICAAVAVAYALAWATDFHTTSNRRNT